MTRITLSCTGVPRAAGAEAARDIAGEFRDHRTWYSDVRCHWDGTRLILEATSDADQSGLALMDEFADCIAAYVVELFDGQIRVESLFPAPSA